MKQTNFSKKRLSATISMLLGAAAIGPVTAQEADDAAAEDAGVEIIEVSGIRGSLARSQDIKRESSGIVDAISAEEMGKFPDTNLAESLNRITGVSISRSNNEGSQITVRGFGPNFNLLTLNGRQMPGTGNNRSFNLENLASTGVSALELYKSARVDVPSGGLGATVDIITAKPLASPGLKYSFSAKGIYDESNVEGDDTTPEIAGLYSQTFLDNTVGISISASYQERSFQQQAANIPGWQTNTDPFGGATSFIDNRPDAELGSAQDVDPRWVGALEQSADGKSGNTYLPRQISYDVSDVQRNRTNTHVMLQFAPRDDMTFSVDYLTNEAETATEGYGFGIWFNFGGNVSAYELDENGTAVRFTEIQNDFAHSRRAETNVVEQDSIGFNWEWQVTDDLHLELDYHDSKVETDNGRDPGTGASSLLIIGPNNIVEKTYDFTQGGVPQFSMTWPGGAAEAQAGDIDPLFAQFSRGIGESTVEQYQLNAKWENPGNSLEFLVNVKAGASYTEQTFGGSNGFTGNQGPSQYNGNQAIFPDSIFTRTETGALLDEFTDGLTTNYYYDFDLGEALSYVDAFFPMTTDPFDTTNPGAQITTVQVTEETTAAYLAAKLEFEIADRILDVNVGVRYEETDVISFNEQDVPFAVRWTSETEWQLLNSGRQFVETPGEHDVVLPALDLKLELMEDVYARFSWGKSITRAPLNNLIAGLGLTPNPKVGSRTGNSGNPNLLPFESKNIDLSFEWYYDEASYIALAYYRKDVKNFITNGLNFFEFDNLRDPFVGPRADEARAQLEAEGIQISDTNLFDRIIANGGGSDDPCCDAPVILQEAGDPVISWAVSQPVNNPEEQTVDGIEFAVSHVFGESGFGASFNATIVDSDSVFITDDLSVQAPLTDISDSANFQVFYEDDQWSVKLTHTWRDDYLIGVGQTQGSSDAPPQYFREQAITDFSINYSHTEELTFFLEGYNINNETEEGYGRYRNQFLFGRQYGPRYAFGVRYTFE